MNKRIFCLFLAVMLVLSGCGSKPAIPTEAPTTEPTVTEAPATEPTVTEAPTTEEVTLPPETEPADPIQELLDSMTLEEKIGQMFIVTPELLCDGWCITEMTEELSAGIAASHIGGLCYFSDNLQTREQVISLLSAASAASKIPLFQCVDEEGGLVSRLGSNAAMEITEFPPMMEIENAEDAYYVGMTIGSEIRELGFNVDFAPVADVATNPDNPVIGSRAFSSDAETAAEQVAAAVAGFRGSGMVSCLKHFPGHGDTATDSHYGYAVADHSLSELESCEFLPFIAGIDAGAPMIMVGHIRVPMIDDVPATLSYTLTTEILREKLGFSGLIVTDSLQMGAIVQHFTSGEAAVLAVQAGVDILLMPENFAEAYQALLDAVMAGEIPIERIDESVERILRCKESYGILPVS